jgi:hypothetical protein
VSTGSAPGAAPLTSRSRAKPGSATATYSIAPSGTTLQPRKACLSVVTQPSTWPSRSHSWVKSWSSVMISMRQALPRQVVRAGMAQVAMLSALMAMEMRSSSRAPPSELGASSLQVALQVGAQQAQHLGVLEQQLAGRGGLERAAAHDQHGADLGLQRPQALRNRRLGDRQALRRALKTALFHDGRQAFQRIRVKSTHPASPLY